MMHKQVYTLEWPLFVNLIFFLHLLSKYLFKDRTLAILGQKEKFML